MNVSHRPETLSRPPSHLPLLFPLAFSLLSFFLSPAGTGPWRIEHPRHRFLPEMPAAAAAKDDRHHARTPRIQPDPLLFDPSEKTWRRLMREEGVVMRCAVGVEGKES